MTEYQERLLASLQAGRRVVLTGTLDELVQLAETLGIPSSEIRLEYGTLIHTPAPVEAPVADG